MIYAIPKSISPIQINGQNQNPPISKAAIANKTILVLVILGVFTIRRAEWTDNSDINTCEQELAERDFQKAKELETPRL